LAALKASLDPSGGLWIAWPKRASGVATDLTENVVRDLALDAGLVDNKVCAIVPAERLSEPDVLDGRARGEEIRVAAEADLDPQPRRAVVDEVMKLDRD